MKPRASWGGGTLEIRLAGSVPGIHVATVRCQRSYRAVISKGASTPTGAGVSLGSRLSYTYDP